MDDSYPSVPDGVDISLSTAGPYYLPGAQIITDRSREQNTVSSDWEAHLYFSQASPTRHHDYPVDVNQLGWMGKDSYYKPAWGGSNADNDNLVSDSGSDSISEADSDFDMNDLVDAVVREDHEARAIARGRGGRGPERGFLASRRHDSSGGLRKRKGARDNRVHRVDGQRRTLKGVKKGTRKPLSPSSEFIRLHTEASAAYIEGHLDLAEELASQAILENPEMFTAHSLLSEIHMRRGYGDRALLALFNGAHTRPRDVETWAKVADLAFEVAQDRESALLDAVYCYNRIIGADRDNTEARLRRAEFNNAAGRHKRAIYDYWQLLRSEPHNLEYLRYMAEACIGMSATEKAIEYYDRAIAHYQAQEPDEPTTFSWSDANIYAELYLPSGDFVQAISRLKSISRWLLGRGREGFWDRYTDDDREFDKGDHPRRTEVHDFGSHRGDRIVYGDGLPLELRTKQWQVLPFGVQLEANEDQLHFEWLEPGIEGREAKAIEYSDLFKEVADTLMDGNHFEYALRFYEPLRQVDEVADIPFWVRVATCYRELQRWDQAETCYRAIIEIEPDSIDAHMELGVMFHDARLPARAKPYIDIAAQRRNKQYRWKMHVIQQRGPEDGSDPDIPIDSIEAEEGQGIHDGSRLLTHNTRKKSNAGTGKARGALRPANHQSLRNHFSKMKDSEEAYDNGVEAARIEWMSLAREALERFCELRILFPLDKHVRFYGYGPKARQKQWLAKSAREENPVIVSNDASREITDLDDFEDDEAESPETYAEIPFPEWLDCFLQYSVYLARAGDIQSAYKITRLATECIVWYHDPEAMFLIHVVWTVCAIIARDHRSLNDILRYFMKERQFVTDSYRLFAAVNRICAKDNLSYNNAPTQKFLLRQIKAVDHSLLAPGSRTSKIFEEKATLTGRDYNGDPVAATEMDVVLLVLYGHILYAGQSYAYSLNYFYRAYALDPENALILLAIALGYIHYALKRQSENRQTLIIQGLSFLHTYHSKRMQSPHTVERQEADYNVGKAYHTLGLLHLAIPYYEQALNLSSEVSQDSGDGMFTEDFAKEAAFALQSIWTLTGQGEKAREIAQIHLVL